MIRKPEPKQAAKAIVALFKAKGISINRALALEVVASVEGYNDWNTMVATIAQEKKAERAKASKAARYPLVDDDDGPFTVEEDGGEYDTFERFSSAEDVAEMIAANLDSESIATIVDGSCKLRAMYVGDHTRHRLYYQDWVGSSVEAAKLHVAEDIDYDPRADRICFGHPDNFYDSIVEHTEAALENENASFVLGYRIFDSNPDTGRVAHQDMNTPIQLGLLVVRGQLRYACPSFPKDILERIGDVFK